MKNIDKTAAAIARQLFTMGGSGERAQRLVLTIDAPTPRNLGGWNERAAAAVIADVLRASQPQTEDRE